MSSVTGCGPIFSLARTIARLSRLVIRVLPPRPLFARDTQLQSAGTNHQRRRGLFSHFVNSAVDRVVSSYFIYRTSAWAQWLTGAPTWAQWRNDKILFSTLHLPCIVSFHSQCFTFTSFRGSRNTKRKRCDAFCELKILCEHFVR